MVFCGFFFFFFVGLLRTHPNNWEKKNYFMIFHVLFKKWSLWGPIVYGLSLFTRGESKGPSRGGLWPKLNNIKHKIALGYSRWPLSPRQTQSPIGKRGKNSIGLSLKENLKYPGKATLTAIQYSALDRAIFFGFYNHPQRPWVWADGTSISLGKFDPTRGRRTVNAG